MKILRNKLCTALLSLGLLSVPVAIPVMTTGCAGTQKAEVTAYKTLKVVGNTAETTIDTWLRYVILKERTNSKIVDETERRAAKTALAKQENEVREIYQKFSSAYTGAVIAARMNVNTMSPEEVTQLCAQLASLVTLFTTQQ